MRKTKTVIIVGGGLAGLSCAVRLHEAGAAPIVLEASDAVGGRVRTDVEGGFLLDRGFQVFLSAYPEAGKLLDLDALDLRPFRPGALVYKNGKLRRMMDVFRCPQHGPGTILQPIGTIKDKLLVGLLRLKAMRSSIDSIWTNKDRKTEDYLRDFGFSEGMINSFFRAFYGGIFLERDLRTSSRMFEFTFKMFADGYATLPAKGMQQVPLQLARRLPESAIRPNSPVEEIGDGVVTLKTGDKFEADAVVIATDRGAAARLVPNLESRTVGWRSVVGLNFSASKSPLNEPIIVLNGEGTGLVNNVCVLTDVSPGYSNDDRALISVSVLGNPESDDIEKRVVAELEHWFGSQVREWEHVRTYRIEKALPEQPAGGMNSERADSWSESGVVLCGDYCVSASIEGAIKSGLRAAERVLSGSPPG